MLAELRARQRRGCLMMIFERRVFDMLCFHCFMGAKSPRANALRGKFLGASALLFRE